MRPLPLLACLSLAIILASPPSRAADAHVAVHPDHGEMVLLRDVHARPAYREVPPSVALIVNPTPNRELDYVLGSGELTDEDFANLTSGSPQAARADLGGPLPARLTGQAMQGMGRTLDRSLNGTAGVTGSLATPMNALNQTTRGIGAQVTGALSQMPLLAPRNGGGP